mmetsp:Transcript_27565/g.62232  ORF Transcript_27565/g.62232 Transcript_27565/m.62232 type:complete len:203 (+) Transcript_27565:259-867(+)
MVWYDGMVVSDKTLGRLKQTADRLQYADGLRRCGPMSRVKFVGTRRLTCPFTGERYHFTIFCGVDPAASCVFHTCLNDDGYDSSDFSHSVMQAVAAGWLRRGDVLVMNNSKVTAGGENRDIEEELMAGAGVAVLRLPPASPRLTPVTAIWDAASGTVDGCPKNPYVLHGVADLAGRVLASASPDYVYSCFCVCYGRAMEAFA